MKVLEIDPVSPLFGYIRPGYSLVAINGQQVLDAIDFHFKLADERVLMTFASPDGQELEFDFEHISAAELGLTLDEQKVKTCNCDCIFCFVRQQPKGMRRALYVKDEDYRLSFTHGNFITLSNITKDDIKRIIEQRLSPMYVSVHATDDTLRRCMLRNEKLGPIVKQLKYLGEHGITIHTQVVLCPGINDGPQLEKTVDDLIALYPAVQTLAVVPVGLTKYRKNLADLRTYTAEEAGQIIEYIEKKQKEFLRQYGTRFVWPADEFYVLAERDFPSLKSYEEMAQFENGVGMVREFITMFNRKRAGLKALKSDKKVLILTGASAFPFLSRYIQTYVQETLGLQLDILQVTNRFWGSTVTVSGLLTGKDLLEAALQHKKRYDTFILPPNCLNDDDLFLDNLTFDDFRNALGKEVIVGQYDGVATIKQSFS